MTQGGLLAFAGLWDQWKGPNGILETCTIITTTANAVMASIHDRMPVILHREDYGRWLAEGGTALLRPCPDAWLEFHPVNVRVDSVLNDDPGLLLPIV